MCFITKLAILYTLVFTIPGAASRDSNCNQRITLLLCTQLKNHSTIGESFYSASGVQAFPTEKKLEALWRARSRSIYSVVQSRDCQNFKSQNHQNLKPWIITTSKQGSSELWRQKSLELWSKNPQNFKAGSSAL